MKDVYDIFSPSGPALPLIFDSPHSGRVYPVDFKHACPRALLERAEDNYVDELFTAAPAYGASLLRAQFPRTYIDVNRAVSDVDTTLIRGQWAGLMKPTSRSHAGIGLVWRLVKPGIPIYANQLTVPEVQKRIQDYYHPYHNALETLIDTAHYDFGQVWHMNCHSMPGTATKADFVLGDRDGTSCGTEFLHMVRDGLQGLGYQVAINQPYKGVEILRRYGRPTQRRHSIQLEINKALYWNEQDSTKTINFNKLRDNIEKFVRHCTGYISTQISRPMAAD